MVHLEIPVPRAAGREAGREGQKGRSRGKGRGRVEQEESQELVRIEREEAAPEEREEELGGLGVTRGGGGAPA